MWLKMAVLASIALMAKSQVPYERLRDSAREPQSWLTYNGSYASTHHSALNQLRADNVARLELKWVWQANSLEQNDAAPPVSAGAQFRTDPPHHWGAPDRRPARRLWPLL